MSINPSVCEKNLQRSLACFITITLCTLQTLAYYYVSQTGLLLSHNVFLVFVRSLYAYVVELSNEEGKGSMSAKNETNKNSGIRNVSVSERL